MPNGTSGISFASGRFGFISGDRRLGNEVLEEAFSRTVHPSSLSYGDLERRWAYGRQIRIGVSFTPSRWFDSTWKEIDTHRSILPLSLGAIVVSALTT